MVKVAKLVEVEGHRRTVPTTMTPGVMFLIQVLPFFLVPVFLAVASQRILVLIDVSTMPIWVHMITLAICVPSYVAFRVRYRMQSNLRDADAMGARLVPPARGKLIGNIDILPQMINSFKHGYIGMVSAFDFLYHTAHFLTSHRRWRLGDLRKTRTRLQYAHSVGGLNCDLGPQSYQSHAKTILLIDVI
jgi:hypothetical protein